MNYSYTTATHVHVEYHGVGYEKLIRLANIMYFI